MTQRGLTYRDAVRVLGGGDAGQDSRAVRVLDRVLAGALLGGAIPFPALLALVDAKTELIRLGHDLMQRYAQRRAGLARFTRSQRLAAALEVLAVTAFFEALTEADLPFRWQDLELTAPDQVRLAGHEPVAGRHPLLLAPGEEIAFFHTGAETEARLRVRYTAMVEPLVTVVHGSASWSALDAAAQEGFAAAVAALPARAAERFDELFRQLAVDVAEVALWAAQREHAATRAAVVRTGEESAALAAQTMLTGLARLEEVLVRAATGSLPDERRQGLAKAYRAELDRPVAASGELPAGLSLPTLRDAYLPPSFRAAQVGGQVYRDGRDRLSDEEWWTGAPVQDDLDGFLLRYLTSAAATEAPLLVLGQPGSGKSVLTKVLAARLPANDYLAVRVELRDVPAGADVQEQIEFAVRRATGERVDWPVLARSAGDAMPVILLDGFDELLQATGVSQTDFLTRVADFQRREADQDRPVAVVVTTRLSVADRALAPEQTVAVRLEPFSASQVTGWIDTWNRQNTGYFAERGLRPLSASAVLAHPTLSGQPLLLLMLALWDADGNQLQAGRYPGTEARTLRISDLYRQLLDSFARREVTKRQNGLFGRDLDRAVETEFQQLSVVAFAMFNRGSQWVTEAALDADLAALHGPSPAVGRGDLRPTLREGELLLGRFFFIHRAQARADDLRRVETYEFLHATFGEFLVARLTWQLVADLAARSGPGSVTLGSDRFGAGVDDDLLWALLSFSGLTSRTPVVTFLRELAEEWDAAHRERVADLVLGLFRATGEQRYAGRFAGYAPRALPASERLAAYTANLMLLAVCLQRSVRASALFAGAVDPVDAWHDQTLLWRAQLDLPQGWSKLVETLHVDRLRDGDRRDVRISLERRTDRDEAARSAVPAIDLEWTYRRFGPEPEATMSMVQIPGHHLTHLRRKAHFSCGNLDDVTHHALEPVALVLPDTVNVFVAGPDRPLTSLAHLLLRTVLAPLETDSRQDRVDTYRTAALALDRCAPGCDESTRLGVARILVDRLATDDLTAGQVVGILGAFLPAMLGAPGSGARQLLMPAVLRCVLAVLGQDPQADQDLLALLRWRGPDEFADGPAAPLAHRLAERLRA